MPRRASRGGNHNVQPNVYQRRKLKLWMLATFGNGIVVECAFGCGRLLFFSEITLDRYPIAGIDGGRYVKSNLRPACLPCNTRHGQQLAAERRRSA